MATNLVPHPGQNILLDASGNIKIADFGLSIDLNEERAVTRAGTLDYMVGGTCGHLVCPDGLLDHVERTYRAQTDIPGRVPQCMILD